MSKIGKKKKRIAEKKNTVGREKKLNRLSPTHILGGVDVWVMIG